MVQLLNDADTDVRENVANAAKALGCLSIGHADNKDVIRDAGGIATMVRLLFDVDSKVRANGTGTLHCLCDANRDAIREAGGIAALNRLLNSGDIEVRWIATDAFSHLNPVSNVCIPNRRKR